MTSLRSGSLLALSVMLLSLSASATLYQPGWDDQNQDAYKQFDQPTCQSVSDAMNKFNQDKSTLGTWEENGTGDAAQSKWWNARVPSKDYDNVLDYVLYCQEANTWGSKDTFENMAVSAKCKSEGLGDDNIKPRAPLQWVDPGPCYENDFGSLNYPSSQAALRDLEKLCGCKPAPPS